MKLWEIICTKNNVMVTIGFEITRLKFRFLLPLTNCLTLRKLFKLNTRLSLFKWDLYLSTWHAFLSITHPNPTHFPVPPYLPSALATSSLKTKQKIKHLAVEVVVCHNVLHSVPFRSKTALLSIVHCSESLFLFKAPSFCYTINTISLLGPLLDILLLSHVMEILQL